MNLISHPSSNSTASGAHRLGTCLGEVSTRDGHAHARLLPNSAILEHAPVQWASVLSSESLTKPIERVQTPKSTRLRGARACCAVARFSRSLWRKKACADFGLTKWRETHMHPSPVPSSRRHGSRSKVAEPSVASRAATSASCCFFMNAAKLLNSSEGGAAAIAASLV